MYWGLTTTMYRSHAIVVACVVGLLSGCAAFTNPVANGIPVSLVAPELLAESKDDQIPLPLNLLRREPPKEYRLGPGDILGVHIGGVLGEEDQPPPVHFPDAPNLPPALGYPIPVRQNGKLPLPLLPPIMVAGMTVEEAEQKIISEYTKREIIKPGRQHVLVTLMQPRREQITVIRQDSPASGVSISTVGVLGRGARTAGQISGGARRGTGAVVELTTFENDILHALAKTGGLPGLDAANEIVIYRGYGTAADRKVLVPPAPDGPTKEFDPKSVPKSVQTLRIPLRLRPGDPIPFKPEDVILHTGDILFIDARDTEVFYTGGFLLNGEFSLPRDYDLDVIEAIAQVGGPLVNGGVNANNLNGSIVGFGIGFPSPSLLTVLRRTPSGRQVPIRIDLRQSLRNSKERLIVKAGDVLILQETRGQAFARYLSQVFNFSIFSEVIRRGATSATTSASIP